MKDECNAVGWNEDEILVRRKDLNKCEDVEEYLIPEYTHAGVLLKRYNYAFMNFALFTFMLSVAFIGLSIYPTMGLNGTLRFLGGYFMPLLIQVTLSSIILRRLVTPMIFPVVSPLPSFLIAYYPYPNIYSPNRFSKAILVSTLIAILIAFEIIVSNTIPIISSEGISFIFQPLVTYLVSGTMRPMALGSFSYVLATFVSLLPYTASIGYYIVRRKNCIIPMMIAVIFLVLDKNLGTIIMEYMIMATIMCIFMPIPSVLNLEEEGSLLVLILYALVASLVVPVMR